MSPTAQAMFQQFDLFQQNPDPDKDIRPLLRSLVEHFLSGTWKFSDLGPMYGVLWFYAQEYDMSWFRRLYLTAVVRIFRLFTYRRPLWNDFHMCLWLLSKDQHYVCKLHQHLQTAIRKRRYEQVQSGQWMINSVCQQDQEFKASWNLAVAEHGEVYS